MGDASQDFQQLRLAVQNLACAPQAQRRYVQLGLMGRAVANLDRIGGDLDPLVAVGELDSEQAGLVAELRAELNAQIEANADFLEEADASPREFLFGHALENEGWHRVRHLARPCYSSLVGEQSPFLAIMAK